MTSTQSSPIPAAKAPLEPPANLLDIFKEYLEKYYQSAQQQSGSVYSETLPAREIMKTAGFMQEWWPTLVRDQTFAGVLDMLHPKSKENVLAQLSGGDRIYAQMMQGINECVALHQAGASPERLSPNALQAISNGIYEAYINNHRYYLTFGDKKSEVSQLRDRPGFAAYSVVATEDVITNSLSTALYALSGVYTDVLEHVQNKDIELLKRKDAPYFNSYLVPVIHFMEAGGLEKSCAYLKKLPSHIDTGNALAFKLLPEQEGIPNISYNLNSSIAKAIMAGDLNSGKHA